jgi:hypothetical protein
MPTDKLPSRFSIRWMALTTLGLAVGMVVGFALGAPTEAIVGMMLVVTVIGAIAGGVFGTLQSLALPPRVPRRVSWSLASAAGMAIGLTTAFERSSAVRRPLTPWMPDGRRSFARNSSRDEGAIAAQFVHE